MISYPNWLRDRRKHYDLFHIVDHSYAQLARELPPSRTVITCHDLDAFRCLFDPDRDPRPLWFRLMAKRILSGLQRAGHVIFVSRTVRDEANDLRLVKAERSSVSYNGIDPCYGSAPNDDSEREARRLLAGIPAEATIILNVGSTIERKRLDLLLHIFAGVRARTPQAKLVRVGGSLTPVLARLANQLSIKEDIVTLPFLSTDVLNAVYRRAALLLQTSESEGFGLPLVEAMACGCPVIASDLMVCREVGGTAADYCPVGALNLWIESAVRIAGERTGDPARWAERRCRSVDNAKRFDWQSSAAHAANIYQQLFVQAYSSGSKRRK